MTLRYKRRTLLILLAILPPLLWIGRGKYEQARSDQRLATTQLTFSPARALILRVRKADQQAQLAGEQARAAAIADQKAKVVALQAEAAKAAERSRTTRPSGYPRYVPPPPRLLPNELPGAAPARP